MKNCRRLFPSGYFFYTHRPILHNIRMKFILIDLFYMDKIAFKNSSQTVFPMYMKRIFFDIFLLKSSFSTDIGLFHILDLLS